LPPPSRKPEPSILVVPKDKAEARITELIEQGNKLHKISDRLESRAIRFEFKKWSNLNEELLSEIFNNKEILTNYSKLPSGFGLFPAETEALAVQEWMDHIQYRVVFLEALIDQLGYLSEKTAPSREKPEEKSGPKPGPGSGAKPEARAEVKPSAPGEEVLVVHGRDEHLLAVTVGFLEKLRLKPVLLSGNSDQEMTALERLGTGNNPFKFAIVLLTPDDVGFDLMKPKELKTRSRQDVVFLLGFLVGKLGPNKVFAIHKKDVQLPGKCPGVVFELYDEKAAWLSKAAQKMRASGVALDLNLL